MVSKRMNVFSVLKQIYVGNDRVFNCIKLIGEDDSAYKLELNEFKSEYMCMRFCVCFMHITGCLDERRHKSLEVNNACRLIIITCVTDIKKPSRWSDGLI